MKPELNAALSLTLLPGASSGDARRRPARLARPSKQGCAGHPPFVNKAGKAQAQVPSFAVKSIAAAKTHLKLNGCRIVKGWGRALCFRGPFGITWDTIDRRASVLSLITRH